LYVALYRELENKNMSNFHITTYFRRIYHIKIYTLPNSIIQKLKTHIIKNT
jgi:hypothetical protein